jgi:hypothetical protein
MTVTLNNSSSWQIQTGTVKSPVGTVWGRSGASIFGGFSDTTSNDFNKLDTGGEGDRTPDPLVANEVLSL